MTKLKNWLKFFCILILTIVLIKVLFHNSFFDIEKIQNGGADLQYNFISTSSIIAGFLFTGISILVSILDNERVKRLWEYNYLDNLYRSAVVGMLSDIVTIVVALTHLCCNFTPRHGLILYEIELSSLIISIIFFVWSFYYLIMVVLHLKEK